MEGGPEILLVRNVLFLRPIIILDKYGERKRERKKLARNYLRIALTHS